ncbi:hypothetical protein Mext_3688 [Methylorubrum extorquens PA1]|nr:hypothetical protein Mext_3688 [Methylorubrum extorquens PA1]
MCRGAFTRAGGRPRAGLRGRNAGHAHRLRGAVGLGSQCDVVGLYLNPPDRALVLSVDEKPQIQAVEGITPVLPKCRGQVERRSHDYKRHGTTDLFVAPDVKAGTIIGTCKGRHHASEFHVFPDWVEAAVPADLDVHVVLDNAAPPHDLTGILDRAE